MLLLRPCSSTLSSTTTRLFLTRSFSASCTQLAKKSKRKQDPAAANEKAILGRPSNNLKVGIVGMPNIG